MRFRLTIDINRTPKHVAEPSDTFESSGSYIENAGPQAMGFTAPHGLDYTLSAGQGGDAKMRTVQGHVDRALALSKAVG